MDIPPWAPTLTDGVVTLRAHRPADVDDVLAQGRDPVMQRWTTVPVPYDSSGRGGMGRQPAAGMGGGALPHLRDRATKIGSPVPSTCARTAAAPRRSATGSPPGHAVAG